MKQPIDIKTPYMTLGQLLKETAIIGSGGQAKWFLKETTVLVNG
ncbi:RNA-binding S4 domain-containing protein, partial [Lactiplantibacillus plantarum]